MSDDRHLRTSRRDERARRSGRSAALVASGILLSRISGVGREIGLRAGLGTGTAAADAFAAALIIPKLLQNLLGEGSLSASFIPVYARLLEDGEEKEAGRVAGAVFSVLAVLTAALVLVGLFLARPLATIVAPGISGDERDLIVDLLRIMSTGIGFIVLAAWCLGVLNAHRRFFLSYIAPVLWNAAIIAGLIVASVQDWVQADIAEAAAWGVLVGGLLQFLVQLPLVLRLVPSLRLGFGRGSMHFRAVLRRFVPAVSGRGVVTLSTYLDVALASLLATGAIAALSSAQVLYLMPISAFALSVAAAELPELSRGMDTERRAAIQLRLGLERISLFLVFSAVAFLAIGETVVAALYERGSTNADDVMLIWLVLAAYSLGMPASGASRLLQNARYAEGDVSGPARIAALRVAIAAVVGVVVMFQLDRYAIVGGEIQRMGDLPAFTPVAKDVRTDGTLRMGAVGLAVGASVAAWVELVWLQRRVRRGLPMAPLVRWSLWRLAPAGAAAAVICIVGRLTLDSVAPILVAPVVLAVAGLIYLAIANVSGNRAAVELMSPILRRISR
ncbi:MAG: murein biosynthesis integral membrane protein MurJ [Acidimicrobiia bacterium]|nr:murein biosynthesis integral membrane protein MurJ [Acidimicrobiia bacterium]